MPDQHFKRSPVEIIGVTMAESGLNLHLAETNGYINYRVTVPDECPLLAAYTVRQDKLKLPLSVNEFATNKDEFTRNLSSALCVICNKCAREAVIRPLPDASEYLVQ